MKIFVNILLIIAIIAIAISLGICKPTTTEFITEHRTGETTSPEVLTILEIGNSTRNFLYSHFIKVPARNVELACPLGQKPDTHRICRKVL